MADIDDNEWRKKKGGKRKLFNPLFPNADDEVDDDVAEDEKGVRPNPKDEGGGKPKETASTRKKPFNPLFPDE